MSPFDRRALALLALLAASALCVATLELRIERTGDSFYRFLIWNLFLAWVPLLCAAAAFARARRRIDSLVVALLLLWLLFFPNAPYMLTDFIHIGERSSVPLWYDALMLSSFAWTALLLGFASLYLVQMVVRSALGARGPGYSSVRRSRSRASACTSVGSSASTAGMRCSGRDAWRT